MRLITIAGVLAMLASCLHPAEVKFHQQCTQMLPFTDDGAEGYGTPFRAYECIDGMPYILTTMDDGITITIMHNGQLTRPVSQVSFESEQPYAYDNVIYTPELIHFTVPVEHFTGIRIAEWVSFAYEGASTVNDIEYFEWNGFVTPDCECAVMAYYVVR